MKKSAVVIHSGGMDSSICLALANREWGAANVLSLSFSYHQRHSVELEQAAKICREWQVDHAVVPIDCLREITHSALTDPAKKIEVAADGTPNTLVVGRNGLMARLGAIHAHSMGASCIYLGVIEVEAWNSGYRDCSREYMDLMERILRIDLADPSFEIRTPLVRMTKLETLELARELNVLDFLLRETITCYEGIPRLGCRQCPTCLLRNEGLTLFSNKYPDVKLPY